jgi:hypothetical protein
MRDAVNAPEAVTWIDLVGSSPLVRRAEVRELGEEIAVRPYAIPLHLPVREDREEAIHDVVAECAAAGRVGRGALGVIAHHMRHDHRLLLLALPIGARSATA